MSSSIFLESSTVAKPQVGDTESPNIYKNDDVSSTDSNLVVVYGKSGVSFDSKAINNLIEEKTLSSISVIRISSPTPSMFEEEANAEEAEMGLDVESDFSSGRDSATDDGGPDNASDEHRESVEGDEYSDGEGNSTDNYKKLEHTKNKKISKANMRVLKLRRKRRNERPEIVGLTVEQFYSPENTKEVVKEALKLAGVSTIKHTADYEFQLYVIKNDHCYTPFTSPAQMKVKIAEKLKAEKLAVCSRKIIPQTAVTMKQLQAKKNLHLSDTTIDGKQKQITAIVKEKLDSKPIKDKETPSQSNLDEPIEDDHELFSSEEEQGSNFDSEESAESDNDRDSDLDFDVNNRKGRKRKVQKKLNRLIVTSKSQIKRQQPVQEDLDEMSPSVAQRVKPISADNGKFTKPTIISNVKLTTVTPTGTHQKPLQDTTLPAIPKRQTAAAVEGIDGSPNSQLSSIPCTVRRGPIIEVGGTLTTSSSQIQSSPQTVKEIIINKVMASPKGGFTDISALLTQHTTDNAPEMNLPTTPTSSKRALVHVLPTSSKGFMPLGIETAAKNQLPSQISVQTHQSSSELAAEHDKHLDFIDLIVNDEMQKSGGMIDQQAAPSVSQNIPELVKMLESTEHALESNKTTQLNNFTPATTVDDIDISNAPLLETPDDDIPDDLLQHVVELIEDDKTLQEAVEKQVFGDDSSEAVSGIGAVSTSTTPPPLAPIFQQQMQKTITTALERSHTLQQHETETKSIIQMAISNVTPVIAASRVTGIHTPKITSLIRKEPIQIVRGNGRVITLPPIEAPTTRAKRRAQTQPMQQNLNTSGVFNESSMDSSLQSNSSFTTADANVPERKHSETFGGRRRVSKEGTTVVNTSTTSGTNKSGKRKTAAVRKNTTNKTNKSDNKNETELEASESQEDDDDPNKLWCVCRQPHNNRFMICCDVCEDWFHGTCVSITKAMGLEMEQKGIDWTCPKCVKKQEEKKQRKISDMLLSTKQTITMSVAPETATPPFPPIVDNTAKEIQNVLPEINAIQSSSLDAMPVVLPKIIVPHKKHLINIKKVALDEQFISLKSLELSKSPDIVIPSVKKKLSTSITNPKYTHPSETPTKRVVVIHNPLEQKNTTVPAGKSATILNKSVTQQRTKALKLSILNTPVEPPTFCIVCKKIARPNSIYCSDDCIRKHAQNALNVFSAKSPEPTVINPQTKMISEDKKKKSKGLFEDLLSMADLKPKVERVNVFERKSGRVLTGSSAPTTQNLKKWLQDNPTFEVVQPGSTQAIEIEKKSKQRFLQSSSPNVNKTFANTISVVSHNQNTISHPHHVYIKTAPVTPIHKSEGHESTSLAKPVKQFLEVSKSSPTGLRPSTPKQLQKYPQHVNLKPDKITRSESKEETKTRDKNAKRHSTESGMKKLTENVSSTTDSEPIRLNVRRTLKDQLLLRMREVDASQLSDAAMGKKDNTVHLTPDEVEQFVTATESEMYTYFNRDTGSKYKAKYRSLMFNIKDRKNQTLFAKIGAKLVEPKQLVRMSPEELASQELAQWRENEAKHQLEMIKKSELDLLSCVKNYVLKTHKGEEVIEGKSAGCVNLDLAIPVEDVVSVLNNASTVSSSDAQGYDTTIALITASSSRKDNYHTSDALDSSCSHNIESHHTAITAEKLIEEKPKSTSNERERARSKEKDRDRGYERRHKNKDHHQKDKSRSRKRSRSQSRSRSRSREKRHKASHKDERRVDKEEPDRERQRGSGRNREREYREHKEESEKKPSLEKKQSTKISQKETSRENPVSATTVKKSMTPKPMESYSLIDQILESTKTVEEAANLVTEKDKEKEAAFRQPNPTSVASAPIQSALSLHHHHSHHFNSPHATSVGGAQSSADSDQEPSSTVSIATPPQDPYIRYSGSDSPVPSGNILSSTVIWGGNINMIDVASFQIILQSVAGNSLNLGKLLPEELDVVGRIGPDTVWDYISKIKKSPNKEIVIIRLVPSSESETVAYTILYQYLDKRNRLGVIKTTSAQIKDFYIFPLGAGKQMPSILQPAERVEFYEDPYRPDLLVGIVIRVIGKRTSSIVPVLPPNSTSNVPKFSRRGNDATDSFTPPGSPKRKKRTQITAPKDDEIDVDAIIKAPIAAKIHKSVTMVSNTKSMDDANEPYSPGGSSEDEVPLLPVQTVPAESELKRKMDELNRQIAAQEMEIAGLLNVEPSRFASSSSTTSTVLANISIPSNLSQILASIKGKLPETPVPPVPQSTPSSLSSAAPPPPLIGSLVTTSTTGGNEEYNPENVSYDTIKCAERSSTSTSRLAQLSEEELLSMVPDDMIEQPSSTSSHSVKAVENKARYEEPPPPPGV